MMDNNELKIKPLNTYATSECANAETIFRYTNESVSNLYSIYQRDKKSDIRHTDQDILRAMLIFSCSGLDAIIKQLIKDALEIVIIKDRDSTGAKQQFQSFVEKKLKKGSFVIDGAEQILVDQKFLAKLLISDQPQKELIISLVKDLMSGSLQSQDELLRVAAYFALTKDGILEDSKTTQEAFKVRNNIIHQMDVDFGTDNKTRYKRNEVEMLKLCKNILSISVDFINAVAERVHQR